MSKIYYPTKVERYRSLAEKYSKENGVPVDVILATIKKESAGNPDAWNGSNQENSRGLMQISEATALSHSSIKIPFMLLDTLFEPEESIKYGSKLLKWIYNYLNPYFPKYVDEKLKWKTVSSSYNQGHAYYKWALQTLDEKGEKVTWESILKTVLNPTKTTKTPWESSARTYGPSIIDSIPDIFLKPVSNPLSFFNTPIQGSALTNSGSSGFNPMYLILGAGLAGVGYFLSKDKKLMKKIGLGK